VVSGIEPQARDREIRVIKHSHSHRNPHRPPSTGAADASVHRFALKAPQTGRFWLPRLALESVSDGVVGEGEELASNILNLARSQVDEQRTPDSR
jgi:hypothetical protein